MKSFVLEKTKYIVNNSWLGLLLPAGVHQLLNLAEKEPQEKAVRAFRSHPAESRLNRNIGSKNRP